MDEPVHPVLLMVIAEALRRYGPEPRPSVDEVAAVARVPATARDKDRWLRRAYAAGGAPLVLRAGQVILEPDLPPHPVVLLFLNCGSVDDLLGMQAQLYRTLRPNHRLVEVERGPNRLVLDHLRQDGSPIHGLESLFVAGLLFGALRHVGCEGLRGWFPLVSTEPVLPAGPSPSVGSGLQDHRVAFRWDAEVRRRPIPALERFLLDRPEVALAVGWGDRVAEVVSTDLTRRWTVRRVAAALDQPVRTLQRRLTEEGTSIQEVLARARVAGAQRLLRETDLSITEIGSMTGFSDTAHFSRRFRDAVGQPPSAWREQERGRGLARGSSDVA
ncbi:MAG: helix-turn-helix transcriptional regulator [Myxococcota bacterium]